MQRNGEIILKKHSLVKKASLGLYMNKKALLDQLIDILKKNIEIQRKSFESARQTSLEAPGRMQSRYDTMGIESAWVADGLAKSLIEKEKSVTQLESFKFGDTVNRVCLGSVVGISSGESLSKEYFFILPTASGYQLCENVITITTLTPTTPVGKALIGKQIGEDIEIQIPRHRTIVIEDLI